MLWCIWFCFWLCLPVLSDYNEGICTKQLWRKCQITNSLSNQTSWDTNRSMPIQFQNNLEATTYPALPHSHLCFGYKLPVWHVPPGLVSAAAKDSATLHIHSTHSINTRKHPTPTRLGQVYKRALVVPPSPPHQRTFVCGACIGTAQVGVSLVSIFRSTLQTV